MQYYQNKKPNQPLSKKPKNPTVVPPFYSLKKFVYKTLTVTFIVFFG